MLSNMLATSLDTSILKCKHLHIFLCHLKFFSSFNILFLGTVGSLINMRFLQKCFPC